MLAYRGGKCRIGAPPTMTSMAGQPEHPAPDSPVSLESGTASTQEDWERAVAAVLRKSGRLGADEPDTAAWARLTRSTVDGVPVLPLGTPATADGLPDPGLPGQAPFTRGSVAHRAYDSWDIRCLVADPDAERAAAGALAELENGATSLWLRVGDGDVASGDLAQVLAPVLLDLAPVVLDTTTDLPPSVSSAECVDAQIAAAQALGAVATARGAQLEPRSNLGGSLLRLGGEDAPLDDRDNTRLLEALSALGAELGVRAWVVDGTRTHDQGAGDVTELAAALAGGVTLLRQLEDLGVALPQAAASIEFRLAATAEQFPTIAKFRASRLLWDRVLELSGLAAHERPGQAQHAVTSRPMMTRYDPWVNMLRTTIAAFGAGVGGAESATVLPFDEPLGRPTELARRNARNTSSLLIHEAHLARVSDPAGGAHAVERLTDDLARAAWEQFTQIEKLGGLIEAQRDGYLQERIEDSATTRAAQIARRSRPLTGVTEFPHAGEQLPEREQHARPPQVQRYAAAFEELRDHPIPTPVYLATFGRVAQHTARATFVTNLLTAGGISTVGPGATADATAVVQGYDGQPVVALAGSDAGYREWGAEVVAGLRQAGARWIIMAGPGVDGVEVDDHAAAGLDALTFLRRTRSHLEGDQA